VEPNKLVAGWVAVVVCPNPAKVGFAGCCPKGLVVVALIFFI